MAQLVQSDRFRLQRQQEASGPRVFSSPIVRVQCKLQRCERLPTGKAFSRPHARGVERVWEQAAWSAWATADGQVVATILFDPLKAF